MAVRLKDIARDLGVSVVTVSKVLRGNSDIGEETRKRVLKRMKELNYQPNMLARGLASGKDLYRRAGGSRPRASVLRRVREVIERCPQAEQPGRDSGLLRRGSRYRAAGDSHVAPSRHRCLAHPHPASRTCATSTSWVTSARLTFCSTATSPIWLRTSSAPMT